jgi:hypothetical protein
MQNRRMTGERNFDSIAGKHIILDNDDRFGIVNQGCFKRPGYYLVDNELT